MIIIKIVGAILLTILINTIVKGKSPEIAFLISISLVACVCISCTDIVKEVFQSFNDAKTLAADSDIYIKPILKCLGVSLVSKIGGEVCRESSNGSAGTVLEFAGTVCALSFTMPVITLALETVCALL